MTHYLNYRHEKAAPASIEQMTDELTKQIRAIQIQRKVKRAKRGSKPADFGDLTCG